MDLDEIKKLVRLVEKSGISELEIEEDGKKIKITKAESGTARSQPVSIPVPVNEPETAPIKEVVRPVAQKAEADVSGLHSIKSPIVGTFYNAPSPDAGPYVKVGDSVEKGQTLCIIEAMKLMNEIESDISGKIVNIVPDNSSPVEFGETLFRIQPS